DGEALDDDAVRFRDLHREIGLVLGEHDLGGIEARQSLLEPPAPARKIRLVMGEEFRHRTLMRRRRRRIEHDGNDLQEMVLFDDDARHAQPGLESALGKTMDALTPTMPVRGSQDFLVLYLCGGTRTRDKAARRV